VAAAIRSQNVEAPAGQIGQPPTLPGQPFQMPIDTLGRLSVPEQFGNIIVKVGQGAQVGSVAPAPIVLSQPPRSSKSNGSNSDSMTGGNPSGSGSTSTPSSGSGTTTN